MRPPLQAFKNVCQVWAASKYKIDRLVYALYGLDEGEIALVEGR